MKRIYHPFWQWEDFQAGMWTPLYGSDKAVMLQKAVDFTGNAKLYGSFMRRVADEWPNACEHNLTEPSMNRLAWIGHAACCMAIQCPEDITRAAWSLLTQEQRDAADAQAQAAVDEWIALHEKQNSQLCLFVDSTGISERDTGRSAADIGSSEQGPELSGNLQSDFAKRFSTCLAGVHAAEVSGLHGAKAR